MRKTVKKKPKPPEYIITTTELGERTGHLPVYIAELFERGELINLPGGKVGIPGRLVRRVLEPKGVDYSFKVLAHVNMRGGIGKTTSTVTAATRAVQYGFKTCVLDLDPQGSASLSFDKMPLAEDPIFYDVWQHPDDMLMGSLKSIQDDLYILPSLLDNALLDDSLRNPADQKIAVSRVCNELKKNGFDLVIIDCPPSLGTAVISTICAADLIVIPVGSDAFSFRGLEMTLDEIKSICQTFKLSPPEIMILLMKFTKREKLSFTALHKLETKHREILLPVVIRTSTAFAKALELKKTVFANTRQSTARDDYDRYVRHILGISDTLMKRKNANE